MPRNRINIGSQTPSPNSNNQVVKTVFLVKVGTAASTQEYDFHGGGITYFDKVIDQSFEYLLIDNIGEGSIRVAFNRVGLNLSSPINGSKTLKAGDVLYIQESVYQLSIYFIENSTVELALMTK